MQSEFNVMISFSDLLIDDLVKTVIFYYLNVFLMKICTTNVRRVLSINSEAFAGSRHNNLGQTISG